MLMAIFCANCTMYNHEVNQKHNTILTHCIFHCKLAVYTNAEYMQNKTKIWNNQGYLFICSIRHQEQRAAANKKDMLGV